MNPAHPAVDIIDGPLGIRFVQTDYPAALQMPPHTHEELASLNFCLSGTVQEYREQRMFLQGPLSLSLMPAGLPHANRFLAGTSTFLVVLGEPWVKRIRQVSAVIDSPLCCQGGRPAWIAAQMHR